ncbi:MAG: helix-turn-helix domain-containing protein [Sedimenticola sp.]
MEPSVVTSSSEKETIRPLAQVEREAIEQAIALCNDNIPRAAAMLEVSPSTIYRKKQTWESM